MLFTAGFTILGGVLVFSLSQLILKFLIEPVHEQRKAIGEILFGLVYYANSYANSGNNETKNSERIKTLETASDEFRRYASQLQSTTYSIRCYNIFVKSKLVPQSQNIEEATKNLIRLSNSMFNGNGRENLIDANQIKQLLILGK